MVITPMEISESDDKIGAFLLIGSRILVMMVGARAVAGRVPSQKLSILIMPKIGSLNAAITKTTP